jgi:hypothetical protein
MKNGKNCMSKMQFKKEKSLWDYVMFKNQDIVYNNGNVLKTKGGNSACPLPLPTPAHAIVRYYLFWVSSQLGCHSGGGKPKVSPLERYELVLNW